MVVEAMRLVAEGMVVEAMRLVVEVVVECSSGLLETRVFSVVIKQEMKGREYTGECV